jgi:hypothetical protein
MAQPKRRKPAKRDAERPAEQFTGFSEREKKMIHDLYRTVKKIVRKKRGKL